MWFGAILTVIVACTVYFLDIGYGVVSGLGEVKDSAHLFRSEAARLHTRTKNLLPNLDHVYTKRNDARSDTNDSSGGFRHFRTHVDGTVKGTMQPSRTIATILFLGGSTTECNEVDEPYRFPALVESLLAEKYDLSIRAINGGVRGHTTVDSINLLLNHPSVQEATHVVLMHNINDRLLLAHRGGYHSVLGQEGPTTWGQVLEYSRGLVDAVWEFVSYRSNLLFGLRVYVGRLHPFSGDIQRLGFEDGAESTQDGHINEHIKTYKQYIAAFIGVTKALQKVPIVMTQALGRDNKAQDLYNEAIREVARVNRVHVIDLDSNIPRRREHLFLSDLIHMNNDGSSLVGQIIAKDVASDFGRE